MWGGGHRGSLACGSSRWGGRGAKTARDERFTLDEMMLHNRATCCGCHPCAFCRDVPVCGGVGGYISLAGNAGVPVAIALAPTVQGYRSSVISQAAWHAHTLLRFYP